MIHLEVNCNFRTEPKCDCKISAWVIQSVAWGSIGLLVIKRIIYLFPQELHSVAALQSASSLSGPSQVGAAFSGLHLHSLSLVILPTPQVALQGPSSQVDHSQQTLVLVEVSLRDSPEHSSGLQAWLPL